MAAYEVRRVSIDSYVHDERRFSLENPPEVDPFVDLAHFRKLLYSTSEST